MDYRTDGYLWDAQEAAMILLECGACVRVRENPKMTQKEIDSLFHIHDMIKEAHGLNQVEEALERFFMARCERVE